MKKVILFAACLFTLSTAVNAQETASKPKSEKPAKEKLTPAKRAQKSVDELNAEVTLSEEQKAKVLALATNRAKGVDAIRAKNKEQKENKEASKPQLDSVRKVYRQAVKSILTPEQLETLKAKHKEKKAAGKPNSLDQD
jgi:Spy/CpxP family protein refolding chaperone